MAREKMVQNFYPTNQQRRTMSLYVKIGKKFERLIHTRKQIDSDGVVWETYYIITKRMGTVGNGVAVVEVNLETGERKLICERFRKLIHRKSKGVFSSSEYRRVFPDATETQP